MPGDISTDTGAGTPADQLTPEQIEQAEKDGLKPGEGEELVLKDGKVEVVKKTETPEEKLFNKAYVDRLRNAADKAAKEAKEAREKLAERERKDAESTGEYKKLYDELKVELDKVKGEHGEALSARDMRLVKAEVKSAAVAAGIIDPTDIALLDMSKVKLTDDGEVEGATEALAAMKKAKPHLFKGTTESIKRDSSGKPVAPSGEQSTTPKDAKDMKPDEFKAVWESFKRVGTR